MSDGQERYRAAVAAAAEWDDEQIAANVWTLTFEPQTREDEWSMSVGLESLGRKVHPHVLAILRDHSLHERLTKTTERRVVLADESPLSQLCGVIGKDPPAEIVALLAPFFDSSNEGARCAAARTVAACGSDESVPFVRKGLTDFLSDGPRLAKVGLSTLHGIRRAIKVGRISDLFRRSVFEAIAQLIARDIAGLEICELLLELDRDRAVQAILDERCFVIENPYLHKLLKAVNKQGILVPRERLLWLIAQLRAVELKYPSTYLMAAALLALGRHHVPEDRECLEEMAGHMDETVAEGATDGLIACDGLEHFRKKMDDALSSGGYDALNSRQQHYFGVQWLDIEVNNGGIHQYFSNSTGETWKMALEGFDAMGMADRASAFRGMINLFGPEGPSIDRERRNAQLDEINPDYEWWTDTFNKTYYSCAGNVMVAAKRYVLAHPESFR
ncbi:MAG: DUF4375 domain-containing protein [Planctomycetaceae bacterium]|nr:DUF4375 domain-containing protein [Planctomycetaceae bacterium]